MSKLKITFTKSELLLLAYLTKALNPNQSKSIS